MLLLLLALSTPHPLPHLSTHLHAEGVDELEAQGVGEGARHDELLEQGARKGGDHRGECQGQRGGLFLAAGHLQRAQRPRVVLLRQGRAGCTRM